MSERPTRFRAASGLELVVYDWGGDGPPVLLAHATGFHGRVWAPCAIRLVEHRRRVWSFDFRGHGASDRSRDGYAWPNFADDVLAVADHLGLAGDPALLAVGHSKGATALLLAELHRPGTWPRVWAYEPVVFPADEPFPARRQNPLSEAARRRRDEWVSPDAAFAAYASKPPLDVFTPEALGAYVDGGFRERADGAWELRCRPEDEAEMYAMGASHGAFARLGEIRCPVLVCRGRRADGPGTFADAIAARLPQGRLDVFDRLGHFGPMQDPDACVASMVTFADE